MSRRAFLVALAVVLVVNAGALVSVARNRAGEPDATLVLEERELELQPGDGDNSGLLLRLRYQHASFDLDPRTAVPEDTLAPRFIDQAKLEALGFDCSVAAGNAEATAKYRAVLPRPAFIVMVLGGPEWERRVSAWQERRRRHTDDLVARGELKGDAETRARTEIAEAPRRLSRLMPVDAGRDAAALRAMYPDRSRYLILRGVVRLHLIEASARGGPSLHGDLDRVFPVVVNVPRALHAPLDALGPPPRPARGAGVTRDRSAAMLDHAPRYEVRVSAGRTFQPWVTEVRLLR